MQTLHGLLGLLGFQLLGTVISNLLLPSLPGPILGLAFCLAFLCLAGESLTLPLEAAAKTLLSYLPLLMIPPAVGLMDNIDTLQDNLLPISAALLGSLLITVPVCGWLMQRLIRAGKQP
ncbi:CidA/LrgA family protein [Pokkaliibacter plantistimulans]|uniref:CidA/LrgA family protein n=1 Tax=Proteobacteria bacterium 228 TaxID=2083153 RepID=A0A2S5KGR2_9PROT|nr:CidA/LrgA family protein [Pokkaliibacter plantistimulans]PPC73962.1 CidA/LrgA family protein [Pokkaliibacter plantistimulans]